MIRRRILVCLLAVGLNLLSTAPARAEHTRAWRQSDSSEFEKGTAKGVAIRSDGRLMPAPRFSTYSDPNLAYLWAMRLDSKGRLYAAGGSDAKVLRFDDPAKPTIVFQAPELAAQAIVLRFSRQSFCRYFPRRQSLQSRAGRAKERLLRAENEIHLGARDGCEGLPVCRHR